MLLLVIGLLLFLGAHSARLLAPDWRQASIERIGPSNWRLLYSAVVIAGLLLIILGYGHARLEALPWWTPPVWTRHLAALLMLPAFILLTATYVPGSALRARIGHPMLAGLKLWALAHLLANGTPVDVLLFGSFLAWAVLAFALSRRRDREASVQQPAGRLRADVLSVLIGGGLWFVFARYLHLALFGVQPF